MLLIFINGCGFNPQTGERIDRSVQVTLWSEVEKQVNLFKQDPNIVKINVWELDGEEQTVHVFRYGQGWVEEVRAI